MWKSAQRNEPFALMSKISIDYGQEGYIKETYEMEDGKKGLGVDGDSSVRYKISQDGENKGKIERIYFYND